MLANRWQSPIERATRERGGGIGDGEGLCMRCRKAPAGRRPLSAVCGLRRGGPLCGLVARFPHWLACVLGWSLWAIWVGCVRTRRRSTTIAAALPAHVLPNARCSSGSERAHALQRHPPLAPQAPHRHSIRTTNGPPRVSHQRRPLTAPRCPSVAGTQSREQKVLAPTTAVAETWCMHTAQPTRDCQGAG